MSSTRRPGLVLAGVAAALWALFLTAVLTSDPEDGADIGAGLLGLLAVPLSVASLVLLLISLRHAPGSPGRRRETRVGAPLAVVSLVLFTTTWVLGPSVGATSTALVAALVVAVVTFLVAAVLFLPPRRSRA